ncbi:MAG: peptidylprolyl isomerase [Microscillaceae bacterium]
MKKNLLLLMWALGLSAGCAYGQQVSKKDTLISIATAYGEMKLVLYDKTPLHRRNFLKLVHEKFYDSLLFHRVIKDFMIQGGDPNSRNAPAGQMLGAGGLPYRVPAEFDTSLFHKKGALAAARDNNPEKASSSCQFYIVQGKPRTLAEIVQLERQRNQPYSQTQKEVYQSLGGTPHLDLNYTVFGEVIQGLEVLDKIATMATGPNDRPMQDVAMKITYEVLPRTKITKLYGYQYPTP